MARKILAAMQLAILLSLSACVTNIAPTVQQNPPPAQTLDQFASFELLPTQASEAAKAEKDALAKIDQHLKAKLPPLFSTWQKAEGAKLTIEPNVRELKFVGGGARFFAGALAGSSAVVMTLKLTDAASGRVVAEPQFYQRAAAMGGAWSIGATDNDMLERIVTVAQEYLMRNYHQAVGGPTGLEEE
jgi:hypothetical protein